MVSLALGHVYIAYNDMALPHSTVHVQILIWFEDPFFYK